MARFIVLLRALCASIVVCAVGGCAASGDSVEQPARNSEISHATSGSEARHATSRASRGVALPGTASSSAAGTQAATAQSGTGAGVGHGPLYQVVSVVDGDTIKVNIGGVKTTIRLIGVDTPETKKPHLPLQCFGKEASSHMQSLVQSRQVQLVADPSQGDTDKYGRLLRYVYTGSTNVALSQIEGGYGREYTYKSAYQYQAQFRAAQGAAQSAARGTWGAPCRGFHSHDGQGGGSSTASAGPKSVAPPSSGSAASTSVSAPSASSTGACVIKGNINSRGEKVAHLPGSATYTKTQINKPGERMFCSVRDATTAGWRIAAD